MVPESIRKIPRPKNTIVQATKNEDVYLVIERVGCRYANGRRLPVNGHVVGHIIDGAYVEKKAGEKARLSAREAHLLRYGNVAFAHRAGDGLLEMLREAFHPKDATDIYALALLRAAFGDLKDYQARDKYAKSWASMICPDASVSKSSISRLLGSLGGSYDLITLFMKKRLEETVKDGTRILIDGMLKSNTSQVNSFSAFSYKGRIKGTQDISIIAAIDAEKKEPLCVKVYPGNLPDHANAQDFIEEFSIRNGLVISDKGFPLEKAYGKCGDGKVGFLHPIKRNRKTPEELGMYESMVPVRTEDNTVMGSAARDEKDGLYYYLFRDGGTAGKEERDFISRKKAEGFDSAGYAVVRQIIWLPFRHIKLHFRLDLLRKTGRLTRFPCRS